MSPQTPRIKSNITRDCHNSVIYTIARHTFCVRAECSQPSIGFDDKLLHSPIAALLPPFAASSVMPMQLFLRLWFNIKIDQHLKRNNWVLFIV